MSAPTLRKRSLRDRIGRWPANAEWDALVKLVQQERDDAYRNGQKDMRERYTSRMNVAALPVEPNEP